MEAVYASFSSIATSRTIKFRKLYKYILRCQRFISKVGGALGTKHLAGIAKLVLCPALHARPHATIAMSYSRPGISIFIRNRQTHNQFCSCNSVAWLHYGQKVRAVKQLYNDGQDLIS